MSSKRRLMGHYGSTPCLTSPKKTMSSFRPDPQIGLSSTRFSPHPMRECGNQTLGFIAMFLKLPRRPRKTLFSLMTSSTTCLRHDPLASMGLSLITPPILRGCCGTSLAIQYLGERNTFCVMLRNIILSLKMVPSSAKFLRSFSFSTLHIISMTCRMLGPFPPEANQYPRSIVEINSHPRTWNFFMGRCTLKKSIFTYADCMKNRRTCINHGDFSERPRYHRASFDDRQVRERYHHICPWWDARVCKWRWYYSGTLWSTDFKTGPMNKIICRHILIRRDLGLILSYASMSSLCSISMGEAINCNARCNGFMKSCFTALTPMELVTIHRPSAFSSPSVDSSTVRTTVNCTESWVRFSSSGSRSGLELMGTP